VIQSQTLHLAAAFPYTEGQGGESKTQQYKDQPRDRNRPAALRPLLA
jgi:hypothetical protein